MVDPNCHRMEREVTRVLICDDHESRGRQWRESLATVIPPGWTVDCLPPERLGEVVVELEDRRKHARSKSEFKIERNEIDDADLLIVDFDLADIDSAAYLNADTVAYLARCYSDCGYIVALNRHAENYFDLTLRFESTLYADLELGGEQIANARLWGHEDANTGFRAWSWPNLPYAVEQLKARTAAVGSAIDKNVLENVGLKDDQHLLSRGSLEFLGSHAEPGEVTFEQFVLSSGFGFRTKDAPSPISSIARIAAARIALWLEFHVLAPLEILVDAPHLVARFPSLLSGGAGSIRSWNACTDVPNSKAAGVNEELIREFRYPESLWLSRVAWYWNKVRNHRDIPEVANPWSMPDVGIVFCEDVSSFVELGLARSFIADVGSPFSRRFVVDQDNSDAVRRYSGIEHVDYRPAQRFAK